MAKMDVKQAYRHVPVDPQDRHLLGMRWRGELFVDTVLPFGLRLVLFMAVADALQWAMEQRVVAWVRHYIDDFFTLGLAGSRECANNVRIMKETMELAGMPTKPEKDEGPATSIGQLGIKLDSVQQEIRLPAEKHNET